MTRKQDLDALVLSLNATERARLETEKVSQQTRIQTNVTTFRVEVRTVFSPADLIELQFDVDVPASSVDEIHASLVYGGRTYEFIRRVLFGSSAPVYLVRNGGEVMSCPTFDILFQAIALSHIRAEYKAGR